MNKEYTDILQKIEAELNKWLVQPEGAGQFSNLEQVFPKTAGNLQIANLFAPLTDIMSRGGKRWRPLLMMLVCNSLGGGNAALPLAPLVEFSHNASLIHDDIEDDSVERRGKPVLHHIYGMDAAINSGSFFYFLSLCCIDAYNDLDKHAKIYKLWGEHLRKLHLGQSMDIAWHNDITFIPSIDNYYAMCTMKTGSLACLAAELGVIAAGGTDEVIQKYGEAAVKLGIGFQILDDVKNLKDEIPGKRKGDDIVEGKKSLPVLLYLHKNPGKRERVFFCFYEAKERGGCVPEVQDLIDLLTEAGVLDEAEEKAKSLINEAREVFNTPELTGLIDLIS